MTDPKKRRHRSLTQIFLVPTILGVLSAIGLVIALIGDGIYDLIGWKTLAVPLVLAGWHMMRPDRTEGRRPAGR